MRKPVLYGLITVIVALLVATGLLYQRYRNTSASYAELQVTEEQGRNKYTEAIDEIAAIQDSLNAIALGDSAVGLSPADLAERRLTRSQGDEALDRIAVIRRGIERTRARINDLDTRLKRSGIRISGLQRMIANLKSNVAEKETQVTSLTARVDSLQNTVTGLVAEVQTKSDTIQTQTVVLEDRRREIGTIYYVIGSKRDLTQAGVIEAKGGVLGLGKTLKPTGQVDTGMFSSLDTDQTTVITVPSEKVEILTPQPRGSYQLEVVNGQTEIRIVDPAAFRTVKHLIIMTA